MNYRIKGPIELQKIKNTRGRYELVCNEGLKRFHGRRKAINGQILRRTENYVNRDDVWRVFKYPGSGFDGNVDLVIEVKV